MAFCHRNKNLGRNYYFHLMFNWIVRFKVGEYQQKNLQLHKKKICFNFINHGPSLFILSLILCFDTLSLLLSLVIFHPYLFKAFHWVYIVVVEWAARTLIRHETVDLLWAASGTVVMLILTGNTHHMKLHRLAWLYPLRLNSCAHLWGGCMFPHPQHPLPNKTRHIWFI